MLTHITRNPYVSDLSFEISTTLKEIHSKRRSTRNFTGEQINPLIIENAIKIAGSAPSGANKQPWQFNIIGNDQLKEKFKSCALKEEEDFYINRPNMKWVKDLKHLHTNEDKSFLSKASHIICIFYQNSSSTTPQDKNYYAKESTGIATGMLISALHLCGVSTLTYTPRNMRFMNHLFDLDNSYKPYMAVIAGVAPTKLQVPQITKKTIEQIATFYP